MSTEILKKSVPLWSAWWNIVSQMRPAFSRSSTFLWFAASLAAVCVRPDLRGVTSFVRSLGLHRRCYERFLDFFHSTAVKLPLLRATWTDTVLTLLKPFLFTVNGRIVLLADGIKAPKTGRKMPGVKKLHQESQNNSKPEYIFGHSCQAIAVVAHAASSFLAVPLATVIHEGVVFSNRDKRTLLDKLILLLDSLAITIPHYLVADRYYASAKVIIPLLKCGQHLITAVRFKIEVTFKQAVHTVGTWCYHFWMADMTPRPNRSGNQHVHHKSERYRAAVRRKLAAYDCHLQIGTIAQGLLQMLAILHTGTVWQRFGSWLRTIRPGIAPSEGVVALALRQCLPEFLVTNRESNILAKLITENLDLDRAEGWCLAS